MSKAEVARQITAKMMSAGNKPESVTLLKRPGETGAEAGTK